MHPKIILDKFIWGKGNINPHNSRSSKGISMLMMDYERVDMYQFICMIIPVHAFVNNLEAIFSKHFSQNEANFHFVLLLSYGSTHLS